MLEVYLLLLLPNKSNLSIPEISLNYLTKDFVVFYGLKDNLPNSMLIKIIN